MNHGSLSSVSFPSDLLLHELFPVFVSETDYVQRGLGTVRPSLLSFKPHTGSLEGSNLVGFKFIYWCVACCIWPYVWRSIHTIRNVTDRERTIRGPTVCFSIHIDRYGYVLSVIYLRASMWIFLMIKHDYYNCLVVITMLLAACTAKEFSIDILHS
jgi:hypothetical protein